MDMKEKDGVKLKMYQRPMEGKSTVLMKTDLVMRGMKLEAFKKFGSDPN